MRDAMLVSSHLEKFERVDAALARLDPVADHELWIWGAMTACTNLLNAALHCCGSSVETDSFHSQVSGVYVRPDRVSGGLTDAMHAPGDVMHFGQPLLAHAPPAAVLEACAALQVLEGLRDPYVRGCEPVPADADAGWREAYVRCVSLLMPIAGHRGAPC